MYYSTVLYHYSKNLVFVRKNNNNRSTVFKRSVPGNNTITLSSHPGTNQRYKIANTISVRHSKSVHKFMGGLICASNNNNCNRSSNNSSNSSINMEKPTVTELLTKPKDEIITFLGGIYEHSSWVAEEFYDSYIDGGGKDKDVATIANVRDLFQCMSSIVDKSSKDKKLELLCSHPDLCAKIDALKQLTQSSQEEQSRAGLGTLTDDERNRFATMNAQYRDKFGFPFILAARHVTKFTVLSAIEGRLAMPVEAEFDGALFQVSKIAWMRLLAAFKITGQKGFLTCHVLDTCHGCPAANMRVQLRRITPEENSGLIKEFITDDDGRLPGGPALKEEEFQVGTYEWIFFAGDYFARKNTKTSGIPFLDEIPIRFGMDDPEEHYHVPLLVSPWSFSTYRGS